MRNRGGIGEKKGCGGTEGGLRERGYGRWGMEGGMRPVEFAKPSRLTELSGSPVLRIIYRQLIINHMYVYTTRAKPSPA